MPSGTNVGPGNINPNALLSFLSPTFTQVNANTTSEQTVTVPGLIVGDFVNVIKPTHQTGLGIVNCRVSAANTLAIEFMNNTGSGITPTASERYLLIVHRFENYNVANPPSALV